MSREQDIFAEATERPDGERAAFLAAACAGDPALRARVDRLLANFAAAASFLEVPPVARPAVPVLEKMGDRIGCFTILRRIGEGGCGVVYLAEQREPIRRQVALKVIKAGMDTHQVVQRFEAERQALALMDHADIAKVFEAGATDAGRPFFAMEWVDGVPITDYCDAHGLGTEARLRLFARVCEAVQHAHQKGVIHRDLKPSNILVSHPEGGCGDAAPKIIDFGIAKATEERLTDATIATVLGQFMGTPAYMSPEQAELGGAQIDTRSDIYSLGVLLYELLTGRTPFEAAKLLRAGFDEMRRQISEVEPARPSARLKTLDRDTLHATAERRHIAAPRLIEKVQGDLDWIVMRCLEKDRERRYASAAGLAHDVLRHLNDEPIEARPAGAAYRLGKLVRRHRLAFAAAAALLLVLVAGVVASTWQAIRAGRAERMARDEAAVAKAVNDFLVADLLRQTDATVQAEAKATPNPDMKLREALDRAAAKVGERFKSQPLVEAAVRQAIGITYRGLGVRAEAAEHLRRALELRERWIGADDGRTLELLGELAIVYRDQGKYAESVELRRRMLTALERVTGPESEPTLVGMRELSDGYTTVGRYGEAVDLITRVIEVRKRRLGDEHVDTLVALATYADILSAQGKFADALKVQEQVYAARKRLWGDDHPETLTALGNLASCMDHIGKGEQAIETRRQLVTAFTRVRGAEHPLTLNALNNLADGLRSARQFDEAVALGEKSVEAQRRVNGPDHPKTLTAIGNLAAAYNEQEKYERAEALLVEVLAAQRRTLGAEHRDTIPTMTLLANALRNQNKNAETAGISAEALVVARKALGPDHALTMRTMNNVAFMLTVEGKGTEAIPLHVEAVERATRVLGREHPLRLSFMSSQAVTCATLGQQVEAVALRREVLAIRRKISGPAHALTVEALLKIVQLHQSAGEFAEMEPHVRELLAVREKQQPDDWNTFNTRSILGGVLGELGRFAEGEPLLVSGYEGMMAREAKIPASGRPRLTEALARLVKFYSESKQPEKSSEWQAKLAAHLAKSPTPPLKR